ncbi:hypothetical protein V1511DRAFT_497884 [Dipodascopsis uninucleata]
MNRKRRFDRTEGWEGVLGTPIAAAGADKGEFVPVWKQEARDERGRKRFHGAFTGGFSAGYFNTVGSKEGWTPKSFRSSRSDRAKPQTFRPEDFMDEEDLADIRESETIESNQSSFSGAVDSPGRSGIDLLLGSKKKDTSMGYILLRKIGWRDGFGIGPVRERLIEGRKVMAPPLKSAAILLQFVPKTSLHGLGYHNQDVGLKQSPKLLAPSTISRSRKSKHRSGIGVGVLNDDDDDDDKALGLEEEDDTYELLIRPSTGKTRLSAEKKAKYRIVAPGVRPHVFLGSNSAKKSNSRLCQDGRVPLEGFELSDSMDMTSITKKYTPPEVPEDYIPGILIGRDPKYIVSQDEKAKFVSDNKEVEKRQSRKILSARERGDMLGETPLPGKSIFDYLTTAQRDKIVNLTGNKNLPPAKAEAFAAANTAPQAALDLIPSLAIERAQGALETANNPNSSTFVPYSDSPAKRKRYRIYLESQAGKRQISDVVRFRDTDWEGKTEDWLRELREFSRAANLFGPLSGMMADRFTTSRSLDEPQSSSILLSSTEAEHVKAARLGMYGPLTRTVTAFTPSRLLCKRFGVRPPLDVTDLQSSIDQHALNVKEISASTSNLTGGSNSSNANSTKELFSREKLAEIVKDANLDVSIQDTFEGPSIDPETNPVLEKQKAPDELFKSVFGDDSDDDS